MSEKQGYEINQILQEMNLPLSESDMKVPLITGKEIWISILLVEEAEAGGQPGV